MLNISQALAVIQSFLAIKSVSLGLGVIPADLDEPSMLRIDKVRHWVRR